jgi:hypothetical protein
MNAHHLDVIFRGAGDSSLGKSSTKWPGAAALFVFGALIFWVGWCNTSSPLAGAFGTYGHSDSSSSPYATAADFTEYVMRLGQQGILEAKPIVQSFGNFRTPWKRNIVTTIFWVGEPAGPKNPVSNDRSSWDLNWTANYGGFDPPEASNRRDYIPVAFIPRQNPFYVALPYNDLTNGEFKPEAPLIIPWFRAAYIGRGQSVCKDRWIAIRKGNRICYAQWEDCGPFRTDHFQYVFGNERPAPNSNAGAGLDVSPAVRDYLGLQSLDVTDWQFVEVRDVPQGPWRSYGDNNSFVIEHRHANEQAAKTQDTQSGNQSANASRRD